MPTVVLSEVSQDKKGREHYRPVDTYCYFLQVDDSSLCSDFLGMTEDAAADQKMIILGKRASQGLNLFQFMEITEQKSSGSEAAFYLNTGMLLPDSIDFKASSIKLFTSQRRPFEMTGGWRKDAPKYYISFIEQGSIIVVREGVGLWANVLLLLACAVCAVLLRRQLAAFILGKWRESSPGGRLFLAVLVLLMAYGTSRGYMHVDTGLYHAQAIRWIEEYGVVPGLGNLHSRFAYNSAAFPLCAIYGMRWMAGGSWTESI